MSLKYECDSCGALGHPSQSGGFRTLKAAPDDSLPDGWARITLTYGDDKRDMSLCVDCVKQPMRFGNTTYELTPPAQPRAIR